LAKSSKGQSPPFSYIFLLTIANQKPPKIQFTNALPHFLFLQNVPTQWLPSKYPKLGDGGEKRKKKERKKKALTVVRPL
jgi:hypothetical protein